MSSSWLVYGAYGFTGRLVVDEARRRELEPILGGRDREALIGAARATGLEHRAFSLDDPETVASALDGVAAVLSCAGPFSATFEPLVRACLRSGAHYLDITGEIDVLEAARALDGAARAAGVALIPGVGFDVVPTDCAAARAAARIADPAWLDLAFVSGGVTSRGSARTIVQALARKGKVGRVRSAGRIRAVHLGSVRRRIAFGDRTRECVAIPWGDVSTAFYSTGVPDVRVFMPDPTPPGPWLRVAEALFSLPGVPRLARGLVDRLLPGPGDEARLSGRARVRCEVGNPSGETAAVELTTPDTSLFTADAAVSSVEALLGGREGGPLSGALTPVEAFGPGFVDGLRDVRWLLP